MSKFNSSTWSLKSLTTDLPDFQAEFKTLHEKLAQSNDENQDIVNYVKEMVSIEKSHTKSIKDCGNVRLNALCSGRDSSGTMKACLKRIKTGSVNLSLTYQKRTDIMREDILCPLNTFAEEYRRSVEDSRETMGGMLKQYDTLAQGAIRAKERLIKLCKEAQGKIVTPRKNHKLQLGSQIITEGELEDLVDRMKKEIAMHEYVGSWWKTFGNTSTGAEISLWLRSNFSGCEGSLAMANTVGQQLVHPYEVIRPVSHYSAKFSNSPQLYYQWSSEEYTRDIVIADREYCSSVQKLDQFTMEVENAMFDHMDTMENLEFNRVNFMRQTIKKMIEIFQDNARSEVSYLHEVYESFEPSQHALYIAQHHAVPKPYPSEDYHAGTRQNKLFGVSLENLASDTNTAPKFVLLLLKSIQSRTDNSSDWQTIWAKSCTAGLVRVACLGLSPDNLTDEVFGKHRPELLVGVLQCFLLALPECLLTHASYNSVTRNAELIKHSSKERTLLLKDLLSNLPKPNYLTLEAILGDLFMCTQVSSKETMDAICKNIGPSLIYSKEKAHETMKRDIFADLLKALIEEYGYLFSVPFLEHTNDSDSHLSTDIGASPDISLELSFPKASTSLCLSDISMSSLEISSDDFSFLE